MVAVCQQERMEMEGQMRVLIADDRKPARLGLKALLTLCPQVDVVGEVADGRAAVDMVAECQPDVVLMDMQMPVMDGLEATARIKGQWPETRVILLTMCPQYRTQAIAAGVDAFLLKGGPIEALQDSILARGPAPPGFPNKQ
jgi:DNA-binding NarL/FixJ family response regulator